jgi:hypothetical protein
MFDALNCFPYNIGVGPPLPAPSTKTSLSRSPNYSGVLVAFSTGRVSLLVRPVERRLNEGNLLRSGSYEVTVLGCPGPDRKVKPVRGAHLKGFAVPEAAGRYLRQQRPMVLSLTLVGLRGRGRERSERPQLSP